MRVCFFIPDLGDGGAQRQCIALLNAMQREPEVDLHLVLLGSGVHENELEVSSLTIHRIAVRNFASLRALVFLVRTLRAIEPDVLVTWLHPADILGYFATRVVRRVRWLMTERDSWYPNRPAYDLRKRLGKHADAILANSTVGRDMWVALAPKVHLSVVPNIAPQTLRRSIQSPKQSPVCLVIGRLVPQKNVEAVVRAFAGFANDHNAARLEIVGDGSSAAAVRLAVESEGIESNVRMLGFRDDVAALMSHARLLISLSLHEGTPNVLVEAVAAALPAVVSDIPEHRAVLGDDYPYYVENDATSSMATAAIQRAWTDAADGFDPYAHARSVLAGMTPDRVVRAYLKEFRRLVAPSAPLP